MSKTPQSISSVAIVEDDAAVLQTLTRIVARQAGIETVTGFPNGEEALRGVPQTNPQIVLMDINLPGISGVECVRRLNAQSPQTLFLMLTVHDDTEAIFDSFAAGASGYLLKPVRTQELLAAIRDVHTGGSPMTSNIARKVVQSFKQPVSPAVPADESTSLSKREKEILDALTEGALYKEIAERLGITYATVHTHIARIYQKLQVRSRGQAVAKYRGL